MKKSLIVTTLAGLAIVPMVLLTVSIRKTRRIKPRSTRPRR